MEIVDCKTRCEELQSNYNHISSWDEGRYVNGNSSQTTTVSVTDEGTNECGSESSTSCQNDDNHSSDDNDGKIDEHDKDVAPGTISLETSSVTGDEGEKTLLTESTLNTECVPMSSNVVAVQILPSANKTVSCKVLDLVASGSNGQNTSYAPLRKSTRCRKRSLPSESHSVCPNCGLSLKSSDLENHLQIEINKLMKMTKHRRSYDPVKKKATTSSCSDSAEITDCHTRYKQYLSVRTRRERRNKAKKRVKCPGDEETTCPVCNGRIVGTPEELAEHVDLCLQEQEANCEGELDIEGEGSFDEYTWAGQTRIRASSLIDGGLGASGFAVAKQNTEDEDMELDIDGDDCSMFGKAQYTEADLIPCNEPEDNEEKERQALRKAVLRAEGSKLPGKLPPDRQRWQQSNNRYDKPRESDCDIDSEPTHSQSEVIESLKSKLKDQEVQLQKTERPKCLICMDWYTKPLTSIQCWHVHCEECWLRTLGTKKLCPQCNTITSPADLRKIYL